tara:strand:- start:358 stop:1248 length:891 start_codon:yes stop_codon:yes gene_type:complete
MEKYSIFHLEGGLGKHVAATAVAKCIKNNHPNRKLIIVCAYPEVFLNLEFIYRVYRIGNTPYFYNSYIKNKDTLIFRHEPYFTTEHIVKRKPLIQNWCKLYKLKYTNEMPELVFNIMQISTGAQKWERNKPVLVIHTNGGPLEDQQFAHSWARDLPYNNSLEVVQHFKNDYHIIQVCRHQDNALPDVEVVKEPMSNMELFSLLKFSSKRLLIDSCLQHAAYAMGLKSTVCWVATSPSIFGYDFHKNIKSTLPDNKLPDSYMFDYSFNGVMHECPFIGSNIINSEDIIKSITTEINV